MVEEGSAVRKRRSHEAIEQVAARLIRREGLRGASVRKVMGEAGLTIGGFYGHFPSKEELIRDAFTTALAERRQKISRSIEGLRGDAYVDGFLRGYLSPDHRDSPETGCPFAALASELPREGEAVRSRVSEEFEATVTSFAAHLDEGTPARSRQKAIAVIALAVGALAMARSLAGFEGSDEILAAATAAAKWFAGSKTKESTP